MTFPPTATMTQPDVPCVDSVCDGPVCSAPTETTVSPRRVQLRTDGLDAVAPRSNGAVLIGPGHETVVRWREGERFEQLFERRCDWLRENGRGDQPAVDAGDVVLSYDQLDARANQLARYLLGRGVRAGDRVGLLFDAAVHGYVGMLAVLKINAAYVPLDIGFPADRLAYILRDARVATVLSQSHLRDRLEHTTATLVCLDEVASLVGAGVGHRLTPSEKGDPVDELCYIIYTSGTTGRPKGVAIEHASICNFVRVAVEVYGIQSRDRVYQGMTIAFDFSVEEIWVALVAGATLVPKPAGSTLLGTELWEFLRANDVSALCCVPTLLATLDEDLPGLRFLLVSGEACPQDLVARWHRPGRRFLNVYGPTEATVTTTWALVHPDRPVTLGVPLPTYATVILDPVQDQAALPFGEIGEIGIAGIGLARGYLNRDDLTARAFIPDFLGIEDNPSGRIYRTGDLGRVNDDGEIEYHGRIDTQVKIRGYRIELAEIESVLLQVPGIAQAVVDTYQPTPGVLELAAYYSPRRDTAGVDREVVYQRLRERLPSYMVPAYLEELASIPMLPSNKADRKNLPPPTARSVINQHDHVGPTTASETILAKILAEVLGVERVSIDSHVFDDLGANSLLMAHFCTGVRKRPELPSVSMKDVYLHPTIRSLAAFLGDAAPATAEPPTPGPGPADPSEPERAEPADRPSTTRYVLCGTAQLLLFLAFTYLGALAIVRPVEWIAAGTGFVDVYLRSVVFTAGVLVVTFILPIVAKWVLIGRFTPRQIPVWGPAYLRFWIVKVLIRANPFARFAGSPLYVLYLRALGAKIGKGVVILSPTVPVCTDLLTIGDGTIIRKTSSFTCYRAKAGTIQTGPVTLGKNVYVGEATVLDIGTAIGDGAQLGHTSSLHTGQAVPDGQHWHGSPAEPTSTDYQVVPPARCGTLRRFGYGTTQLLTAMLVTGPVVTALLITLLTQVPWLDQLLNPGAIPLTQMSFYIEAMLVSLVLFFGGILLGLILITTVPRLYTLALRPGKVYPLFGFAYWVQRVVARRTNSKILNPLFGDSSYIVYYLRALGYDLSRIEQSGSNFGMAVQHDSPYLSSVGTGTMVSDGLTFINADFSSTSFTMSRTAIGARNFLGNNIAYPAQGRTGDNCLLGTKVMIPIDGEVREGVGLLGSPPFEIPRSVQRDSVFDEYKHGDEQRRRLAAKNRHNLITMAIHLFVRWVFFSASLLIALVAGTLLEGYGEVAVQTALIAELGLSVAYFTLVGRATTGFRDLKPRFCSVYDRHFWRHERYWKVPSTAFIRLFNGTPFKGVIWRLLGVRVGRRLFDDGCGIVERTLVSVGNDCTLNAGSVLQGHSLEDGTFKSDHITLGDDCTLGINAFVHYGVRIGDGAVLDPDSFLMKGEEVRPHAQWRGNPATERTAGSSTNTAAVTLPVTPVTEAKPRSIPAPRTGARPQRPGQRGTHPQRPAGPAHRRRAEPSPDGRGRHRWSEPHANTPAAGERDTS